MKKITILSFLSLFMMGFSQDILRTDYPVYDGTFAGSVYSQSFTFPSTGADDWAGFANDNTNMYPLVFNNGGLITFKATTATDTEVRFLFEANPYPNNSPAFDVTVQLLASHSADHAYSVAIPAYALVDQNFNSAIFYVTEKDVTVTMKEAKIQTYASDGTTVEKTDFPVYKGVFAGSIYSQSFTFPSTGADDWAGFANNNTNLYPMTFNEGGKITFKATTATDTSLRFLFEANPYPNNNPLFDVSVPILASLPDNSIYTVDIPAYATIGQNFNSAILYVVDRGIEVTASDFKIETYGSSDVLNPLFDFETVNYTVSTDGAGGASPTFSVVADPFDATNTVGKIVNSNSQYANTQFTQDVYVDLTGGDKTISFRIWSDAVKPGLLKLESSLNGNPPIEKSFTTSGTGWETIDLNFSSATYCCGNTNNVVYDQYRKFALFMDFGVTSTGTYYIDDFEGGVQGAAYTPPVTSWALDFETVTTVSGFEGLVYTDLFDNDLTDGINTSAKVGKLENVNAANYCHIKIAISPTAFDLSANDKGFSIMYKGNRATPVKLKLEGGSVDREVDANYTNVGVWQKLLFDFSGFNASDLNTIVLFTDILGPASLDANDDTFMIDNIVFGEFASLSTQSFELSSAVKMFPNPAKDTVQFSVNSNENLDIQIFDMLGKSVLRVDNVRNAVNVSELNSGLYFVQMTLGTQKATKKLVIN
jgi:hypothetical protein